MTWVWSYLCPSPQHAPQFVPESGGGEGVVMELPLPLTAGGGVGQWSGEELLDSGERGGVVDNVQGLRMHLQPVSVKHTSFVPATLGTTMRGDLYFKE